MIVVENFAAAVDKVTKKDQQKAQSEDDSMKSAPATGKGGSGKKAAAKRKFDKNDADDGDAKDDARPKRLKKRPAWFDDE